MSYLVLARKWRPKNFDEVAGQEHVLRPLRNALEGERLHHACLFTGTRGVGKTTLARIVARCLNCERGVSASPCGQCSACIGIDQGRFPDLIEVDAASRARVEETRELMDNVPYAPAGGRYKVYLIDEVHMFSNHSFNALLKVLEEPPEHVQFLFATTEPKRVPITILSRCLQFNLRRLGRDQIVRQLERILQVEKIPHGEGSIAPLAAAADGSLRDALSLLDQAITDGDGRLDDAQVRSMLGMIDRVDLMALLRAVAERDGAALLRQVRHVADFHPDYSMVLTELLELLQRTAVCQTIPDAGREEDEAARRCAELFAPEEVQLLYQIALHGRRDLALAPEPRVGFEMSWIRMLAFRPAADGQSPCVPAAPRPTRVSPPSPRPAQRAADREGTLPAGSDELSEWWHETVRQMNLDALVGQLAQQCVPLERSDRSLRLALPRGQAALLNDARLEVLQQKLREHFGNDLELRIAVEDAQGKPPARHRERERIERQREAVAAIENDPNVRSLQKSFGAILDRDSIRSV